MVGAVFSDNFFWFLLAIVIMAVWLNRPRPWARDRRYLSRIGKVFNPALSQDERSFYLRGLWHGLKFNITLQLIDADRAKLIVVYEKKAPFKLNIYEDSAFCELDEKIGGANEVKTGEEAFDRKFLIFSNRPDQVKVFLADAKAKDCVRSIVRYGFKHIKVNGKTITLERTYVLGHLQRDLVKFAETLHAFANFFA